LVRAPAAINSLSLSRVRERETVGAVAGAVRATPQLDESVSQRPISCCTAAPDSRPARQPQRERPACAGLPL